MVRLTDPIRIGNFEIRNRLYRAPVLEGAGTSKDPGATYRRHFEANTKAGLGLVIQGSTSVTTTGKTSPGMTSAANAGDVACMRPMTDAVHAAGGRVVMQLGHGGLYALESWNRSFMGLGQPIAVSAAPPWLRVAHRGARVLASQEIGELAAGFGRSAQYARDAGYDGVQVAASNAKLLHQFLSRTYNRRTDRYGGSLEARGTILREIRDAIAVTAGPDYPVLLKLTAHEVGAAGHGITLDEGVALSQLAQDAGYAAVTPVQTSALPDTSLCRGDFPQHSFTHPKLQSLMRAAHAGLISRSLVRLGFRFAAWQYPYDAVWNQEIFARVKEAVNIPVFAVGGIREPVQAARILANGHADMIGIGRPFYTEPDLAERFLGDAEWSALRCENCNRCVLPQMLGLPAACYNPASQAKKSAPTRAPVDRSAARERPSPAA